ncbi:MAG: FtsQ-type POTRA domain-containing protein [Clostridia bacterium]|nr:FtsQ-type POTRA domain-containing protein [Clostridia bacterium]
MAKKRGKTKMNRERERARKAPSVPPRPAIDLASIKARYSARPLSDAPEDADADIQFLDAETLTREELEKELAVQTETDIDGEETGFSEEALSLFDEEDKPKRKKKGKNKKAAKSPASLEEDDLDFVDLAKVRRTDARTANKILEKAVVFSAVVFMVGILLILYYWLLIDRIEVTGNETLERADVLTVAGINAGEHILLVNTGEARKKLLENPRIKSAQIRRVYPDKLVIQIEERKPLAAIAGGGSYAIIDKEGYILSIGTDSQNLLEVYGMGSTGFQLNKRLGEADDFNSAILLSMVQALDHAGVAEDMASLDITQPLSVQLLTKDGYTIHVGQAEDLEEKLQYLSQALAWIKAMGHTGGVIDLAVRGDPVYSPPTAEPTAGPTISPVPEESPAASATPLPETSPAPSPSPGQTPSQAPGSDDGDHFSG